VFHFTGNIKGRGHSDIEIPYYLLHPLHENICVMQCKFYTNSGLLSAEAWSKTRMLPRDKYRVWMGGWWGV